MTSTPDRRRPRVSRGVAETIGLPARRRGSGRRHAGQPARREPTDAGGPARARVRRLLLPDRVRRVVAGPRLRLLRARPAQVRPLDPAAPDPDVRRRPARVLRRDRPGHVRGSSSATATTRWSPPRHSTGGLTVPALGRRAAAAAARRAWCSTPPGSTCTGSRWPRSPGAAALLDRVGRATADARDPREVTGFYTRSLHRDHEGDWDFDLTWKPVESFPVRAGWLRAIRQGHAAAAPRALGLPARCWCCPRAAPSARRRWATTCTARRRARRTADPAVGTRRRPARHLRRGRRRPPRRRALPGGAAGEGLRRARTGWHTAYVDRYPRNLTP